MGIITAIIRISRKLESAKIHLKIKLSKIIIILNLLFASKYFLIS
jgi:hypothetical protein